MKNFFDGVKLFLLISGAVMGAGFLSGGELVAFFDGGIFYLSVAAIAVFIGFAFISVPKDAFSKTAFLVADGVFAVSMLSGLDEITAYAGILKGIPVASLLSLTAFVFLLSKDIKKVEKVNCVLIPLSVIIVLTVAITAPANYHAPVPHSAARKTVNALLYACMNVFVAIPSVDLAKQGKSKSTLIFSTACFAAFFAVFAFLIIRVSPKNSMPLLDISRGTVIYPLLIGAIFIGSFTSLVCYLYPLKNAVLGVTQNKKQRDLYCFITYSVLFLLSRVGIENIIKYFYPIVGALGLFSIVKSIIGIKIPIRGDTMRKRSAICQERKRPRSKNLPKRSTGII